MLTTSCIIIKTIARAPIHRTGWERRALYSNTNNTYTHTHSTHHPRRYAQTNTQTQTYTNIHILTHTHTHARTQTHTLIDNTRGEKQPPPSNISGVLCPLLAYTQF